MDNNNEEILSIMIRESLTTVPGMVREFFVFSCRRKRYHGNEVTGEVSETDSETEID